MIDKKLIGTRYITPGEEHIYYNNSDTPLGLIWIEFYGGRNKTVYEVFYAY